MGDSRGTFGDNDLPWGLPERESQPAHRVDIGPVINYDDTRDITIPVC